MKPIERLTLAADMLRRSAPGLYNDFVEAADACYEQSKENLVAASSDALPGQQGNAAAWRTVSKTIREAHTLAAALKGTP